MASRAAADWLLAGDADQVAAAVIAPASRLWDALLPADRVRVLEWTRRPRAQEPRREPRLPTAVRSQRLVSDMMREDQRGMRLRTWRDVGSLVTVALAGAGVAVYVRPPVTGIVVGGAVAWLFALVLVARHVAGRAQGRGVVGTAEGNAAYFADPERHAVGGLLGFSIGAGLGMAAMLLALVAA